MQGKASDSGSGVQSVDVSSNGGGSWSVASGTTSWSYSWGADSLIMGENFVCCVPFEDQAATTNNLGLGTPFAGNLEVYPVYRIGLAGAVEETERRAVRMPEHPTVVRGVLLLPKMGTVPAGTVPIFRPSLLDVSGRNVLDLKPGPNDLSRLAPGSRRTMPIVGSGHSPWLFWDGRKDSLWSQALGPFEDAVEHGGNRARYASLHEVAATDVRLIHPQCAVLDSHFALLVVISAEPTFSLPP